MSQQIELFSSESGIVKNRELIRVFGRLKTSCNQDFIEIKTSQDGDDEKIVQVPLLGNKFKFLTRLKKNCENQIEFCSAKKVLKISQESAEDVIFDVKPLYIIPRNHDGKFQTTLDDEKNSVEDAIRKIDLGMELSQCVIGEKIRESMKIEKNFVLRKCEAFHCQLSVEAALTMNQWEIYDAIASELVEKFDVNCRKFVGFLSCTKFEGLKDGDEYSYVNIKSKTFAYAALGGGFLCLMGSGSFFSWPHHIDDVIPALADKKTVDISQVLDDSNYRKTYGGCFATSLGSLIHEIGHVFDLAHTETGLMGNDIDFIHRFFLADNLTEILPKRNVRSCQLTEGMASEKIVNSRFTKLRKPGGEFLEKYREQKDNDMTFFEENCLITLFNHCWFTQTPPTTPITFNDETRTLSSQSPLKLVEFRCLPARNSMLIKFFSLMNENVNEFTIPPSLILQNISLFAITNGGDIFKRDF